MSSKLTTEEFIRRAQIIHNNIVYDKVIYNGTHSKVILRCPIHGQFRQTPHNHLIGCGCPSCGGKVKLDNKSYIKRAKEIHGNFYDYSELNYQTSESKVKIICPIHGQFFQLPYSHLKGHGCSHCGGSNKWTTNQFIKIASGLHKNKYDYSETVYTNNNTKVTIICPIHGKFQQRAADHIRTKHGCAQCSGVNKKSNVNFIKDAIQLHGNKYDYSNANYKNDYTKVIITCQKHGDFLQSPNRHLQGDGCPKCTHKISVPEIKFLNYCRIPDNIHHRQKYIAPYKVDAEHNGIIYEFLGDYWHGNPSKYSHKNINQSTHKTFGQLYADTVLKFQRLNQLGYKIRYIWESDWLRFENGITSIPKIIEYNGNLSHQT
jgi:hypothetical protein